MAFSSTRKAITVAATFVVAMLVAFSTLLVGAAPSADAAEKNPKTPYVNTASNRESFNSPGSSAKSLEVRMKVTPNGVGSGLRGTAKVYINGKHLQTRHLKKGRAQFNVDRSRLPNNKRAEVKVHVYPASSNYHMRVKKWSVLDRKSVGGGGSGDGAQVVAVAKKQVGDRYVWGAAGPSAFDCSGLVKYSYKHATGQNLPHSSAALKHVGKKVSRSQTLPGDLAVSDGHVSIILDRGASRVVEAATPASGVRTSAMWQKGVTYVRP